MKDGTVHLVVGTGGKHKDVDDFYPHDWSLFRTSMYGYGRVRVENATSCLFEFVANSDGKVKDHVWIHK